MDELRALNAYRIIAAAPQEFVRGGNKAKAMTGPDDLTSHREQLPSGALAPGARAARTDRARLPPEIDVQPDGQGADLIHT
jgi:hypothetical protein